MCEDMSTCHAEWPLVPYGVYIMQSLQQFWKVPEAELGYCSVPVMYVYVIETDQLQSGINL